jgi:hypothetical protein
MKVEARSLRRLLAASGFLLVGTLAAALAPVRSAEARPCPITVDTYYYFDAAKTQYAGYCQRACNLRTTCEGTQTIYSTRFSESCGCGVFPP